MPELPEVETVRRVLQTRLAGRAVAEAVVPRVSFYRKPPAAALRALAGRRLTAVCRRGKYLSLELEGAPALTLHLGMSGRLFLCDAVAEAGRHCRFELRFAPRGPGDTPRGEASGERPRIEIGALRFYDPRRFGRVGCPLPAFGPEPLSAEFDAGYLRRSLRGRRAPIKALLMDQGFVAGLGNIYATEALFRAGIRPGRRGASLRGEEIGRLAEAVRAVLERGIALGGCTLDDEAFLDPLGNPGRFQEQVAVYGRRGGEPGACGHALKTTRRPIAGRTSVYCPECQR